jgi:hypothetical protein
MSWFDGIGAGVGSMLDMFTGMPSGSTSAGASAVGGGLHNAYDNTDFGKATGLAPYMKMLGIGSTPPAAAAAPAAAGSGGYVTPGVSGQEETKWQNYFGKTTTNPDGTTKTQGGFNLPSYANWDAVGRSGGNRESDHEAEKAGGVKVAAPEIYQPDLSKIPRVVEGQTTDTVGAGHFSEHAYGSHTDWDDKESGWSGKTKFNPGTGKGGTTIYSTGYQAGVEEKEGYRAVAFNSDKTLSASAEAGMVANAGLSGSIGLDTENGLYATGGIGAKSGLYAQADADAKTSAVKIGGVDYDAGIGVHGDTFVGAKAGASGTIGIGPDFIGAKGNIGAFAGAEAAGDIHGNLGPVGAKLGASGMVGAGIGADGDVSYKDGQFHIGGKLFACLGYGGSISGDITIDFGKIAKSLGPVGEGMLHLAEGGIGGAAQIAGGLIGGAVDLGQGVVQGLGDVGAGAISGIGALVGGIGEGIGDVTGGLASGVGDAVGGVLSGVGDVASGIGDGFSNFAQGDILSGIGDIGGGVINGIGDVAGGLGRGALDVLGGVGSGLLDVGGGIVSGVGSAASGIANGIGSMASGIGSAVGDVLSW